MLLTFMMVMILLCRLSHWTFRLFLNLWIQGSLDLFQDVCNDAYDMISMTLSG